MKLEELRRLASAIPHPVTQEDYPKVQALLREMGLDPGNLYQELEMSVPYVQAHQDRSYSNASVRLHSHSFYELLCCRNTCGAEYILGASRYRLQRGDIILVPPGVSHRPLLPQAMEEPYIRDVLWISAEYVQRVQAMFPGQLAAPTGAGVLLRTRGSRWESLSPRFRTAVEESEGKAPGWEMALAGVTLELMASLGRAMKERNASPPSEAPGLLDRALAIIEQELAAPITLEETARRLFVSQSTLTQVFRQKMGVSFYHCVTQRRLIAAKELILEGVPLEAVGSRVGFGDYSGFYRAFRREYGISPRDYKKRIQGGTSL